MSDKHLIIEDLIDLRIETLRARIIPENAPVLVIGPQYNELDIRVDHKPLTAMIGNDVARMRTFVDNIRANDILWVWLDYILKDGEPFETKRGGYRFTQEECQYIEMGYPDNCAIQTGQRTLGSLLFGHLTKLVGDRQVLLKSHGGGFDVVVMLLSAYGAPSGAALPISKWNKRCIRRVMRLGDLCNDATDEKQETFGDLIELIPGNQVEMDKRIDTLRAAVQSPYFCHCGNRHAFVSSSHLVKELVDERESAYRASLDLHPTTREDLERLRDDMPRHVQCVTDFYSQDTSALSMCWAFKILSNHKEFDYQTTKFIPERVNVWAKYIFGQLFDGSQTPNGYVPLTSPILPFFDLLSNLVDSLLADEGDNPPKALFFTRTQSAMGVWRSGFVLEFARHGSADRNLSQLLILSEIPHGGRGSASSALASLKNIAQFASTGRYSCALDLQVRLVDRQFSNDRTQLVVDWAEPIGLGGIK